MALGGNEVSGYHTGPASILGQLVGVQHSHLDNAGYSVDQKAAKMQLDPERMVDEIIREDNSRGVFNSLVGCLFARGVYGEENIIDALGAIGIAKTKEDLQMLGQRIFDEKYRFKVREGFDLSRARVPRRFYETVSTLGKVAPETVEERLGLTGMATKSPELCGARHKATAESKAGSPTSSREMDAVDFGASQPETRLCLFSESLFCRDRNLYIR